MFCAGEGVETSLEDFVSKLRGEATVETTVDYKVMEVKSRDIADAPILPNPSGQFRSCVESRTMVTALGGGGGGGGF
jgi:hypothetical protein